MGPLLPPIDIFAAKLPGTDGKLPRGTASVPRGASNDSLSQSGTKPAFEPGDVAVANPLTGGRKVMAGAISPQLDLFGDDAKLKKKVPPAASKPPSQCTRCFDTFLSDHEVAKRYGVSRAAIWRWVKNNPDFAKPIKLTPGSTRWKLSDLVRFETDRERDATTRVKTNLVGVSP